MTKNQKELFSRLMFATNKLGGTLDATATCISKYIERQKAHHLTSTIIYGLFGDNKNNPNKDLDVKNAYKAMAEMEELAEKEYPDRYGKY